MKFLKYISLILAFASLSLFAHSQVNSSYMGKFDKEKDLLLAQFDCKTDVDDLHSVAAFATILGDDEFSGIRYYAVAGAYGIQGGLYVPPNDLFAKAFGGKWSDAHANFEQAVDEVYAVVIETIQNGGSVWVAEAGQSDFSASVIEKVMSKHPGIDLKNKFHVVQHSNWNEESTAPDKLQFVKANIQYHKIADGNAYGNGTPCYRTEEQINPLEELDNAHLKEVWDIAIKLANRYNGSEGRYNNEAIAKGGLDFSDVSEISWILEIEGANTVNEFLKRF